MSSVVYIILYYMGKKTDPLTSGINCCRKTAGIKCYKKTAGIKPQEDRRYQAAGRPPVSSATGRPLVSSATGRPMVLSRRKTAGIISIIATGIAGRLPLEELDRFPA